VVRSVSQVSLARRLLVGRVRSITRLRTSVVIHAAHGLHRGLFLSFSLSLSFSLCQFVVYAPQTAHGRAIFCAGTTTLTRRSSTFCSRQLCDACGVMMTTLMLRFLNDLSHEESGDEMQPTSSEVFLCSCSHPPAPAQHPQHNPALTTMMQSSCCC
jgi:hypothetical protein